MKVGSQLGSYIKTNYDIFGAVREESDEELEIDAQPEARVSTSAYDEAASQVNVGSYEVSNDDFDQDRDTLREQEYNVSAFFGGKTSFSAPGRNRPSFA